MTARTLARLLRRAGVYSRSQRHDSGERGRGYDAADFTRPWDCWLREYDKRFDEQMERDPIPDQKSPDLSVTNVTTRIFVGFYGIFWSHLWNLVTLISVTTLPRFGMGCIYQTAGVG